MVKTIARTFFSAWTILTGIAGPASGLAAGDVYIVTSGKGETQVVVTTAPMATTVAPGDNPSNQAAGTIETFVDKKGVSHFVFHGTLNGEPDPKPGKQGWGYLSKVGGGGPIAGQFATLMSKLNEAANLVSENQATCDGPAIEQRLMDAYAALSQIGFLVSDMESLPSDERLELLRETAVIAGLINELKSIAHELGSVQKPSIDELGKLVKRFRDFKGKHKKLAKELKALLQRSVKNDLITPG